MDFKLPPTLKLSFVVRTMELTLLESSKKVAANVIAMDGTNWFSSFTIDKGSKEGIKKGMNVIAGRGRQFLFSGVFECRNDKHLPQMLEINDRRNGSRFCQVICIFSTVAKVSHEYFLRYYVVLPNISKGTTTGRYSRTRLTLLTYTTFLTPGTRVTFVKVKVNGKPLLLPSGSYLLGTV